MRRTPDRLRQRLSSLREGLGGAMSAIDLIRRETAGRTADESVVRELRQRIRWAAVCLGVIHRHDPLVGETVRGAGRGAAWACVPMEAGGESWDGEEIRARSLERLRTEIARGPGVSPDWPASEYRALWLHPDTPHLPAGMRLDEEMLVALALAGALELLRTLAGADADGRTK